MSARIFPVMTPAAEVRAFRAGARKAAHLSNAAVRLLSQAERDEAGFEIDVGSGRILLFASPEESRRRRTLAHDAGPDPDAAYDDR